MESSLKNKNCIFNLPLLISLISRVSLRRQGVYLRAVNLHGQRPSSIPASEVSHVTVNRDLLWTKHQRVYLASSRPYGKRGSRKKIKSRQLMWMFIIKVVMLAAILFLKWLFSVILLFSYSLLNSSAALFLFVINWLTPFRSKISLHVEAEKRKMHINSNKPFKKKRCEGVLKCSQRENLRVE